MHVFLKFILGIFVVSAALVAVLFLYLLINSRVWASYAYEVNIGFSVDGEEVRLVERQICVPGWEYGVTSGAPQFYYGGAFSVGRSLERGGAVFALVPNKCGQRGSISSFDDWEQLAARGEIELLSEDIVIYLADDFTSPNEFVFLPLDSGVVEDEPNLVISHATWRPLLLESNEMPTEIVYLGKHKTALRTPVHGKYFEPVSPDIRTMGQKIWSSSDSRFDVFKIEGFSHELSRFIHRWQFYTGTNRLPPPIYARRSIDYTMILESLQSRLKFAYPTIWRDSGFRVFGEDVLVNQSIELSQSQLAIFDGETQNMYFESYMKLPIVQHVVRLDAALQP